MRKQPVLETKRLSLRPVQTGDAEHFYSLDSDPLVMKYISGGKVLTFDEVSAYVPQILERDSQLSGLGLWMAFEKSSHEFVGWFGLKPLRNTDEIEIGYRLRQAKWSQGFATEGGLVLLDYGFQEIKLSKVVAITDPQNLASQHVLQKIGLKFKDQRNYQPVKNGETIVVKWFEKTL